MATHTTLLLLVIMLFMIGSCASMNIGAAPAEDELPSNKKLGSIFNDDGAGILEAVSGGDVTPDEYRKVIHGLLDSQMGVLAMCMGLPDPVWYESSVATTVDKHWRDHYKTRRAYTVEALRAAGTDCLRLVIEVCRERGVPFVPSYRMNAEDHADHQLEIYDFGIAHKHLRIPDANCLDPIHPEVFEHRMAIFREVATKYDIDGIEFDFRRWYHMVSDPHKNHVVLTRMVRETRKMLDEVAKAKGRKRLLLGVRVGPSIDTPTTKELYPGIGGVYASPSCKDLGLDVRTWIKQELVDYVSPTLFWPRWPGLPLTREFAELAKGTNVGIYPTLWPVSDWMNDEPIEPGDTERLMRYKNEFCRLVLKLYDDGADGISTFNWTPYHRPEIIRHPNRTVWGIGAKLVQEQMCRRLGSPEAIKKYLEQPAALDG